MTGFAAITREDEGVRASVTIKSVNHRFLDVALKAPAIVAPVESRLRQRVQQRVARGRVEISVSVESTLPPEREVVLDESLLGRIGEMVARARATGLVDGTLSASDLLRVPQLVEIRPKAAAADAADASATAPHAGVVERALDDALDALVGMRETEGRFLAADLDGRVGALAALVTRLETMARDGQSQLEARLRERVAGLPADLAGDPAAIGQEIVRFVARSDIDEEIVRLRGHFEHWRGLAAGAEPCGRKLDFLVQEMNREINTIGSKIEGTQVGPVVIDAKAELERIREQVQNVE
jgi:uncharacterized protein (TIGR00255 family)